MTGNWSLPNVGTQGTIQNTVTGDNGYLMIQGDGFAVEEGALDVNNSGQQWERSTGDDSGYFTLKNPKSGKFLSGHKPLNNQANILTIEGTTIYCLISLCSCFFTILFFYL